MTECMSYLCFRSSVTNLFSYFIKPPVGIGGGGGATGGRSLSSAISNFLRSSSSVRTEYQLTDETLMLSFPFHKHTM